MYTNNQFNMIVTDLQAPFVFFRKIRRELCRRRHIYFLSGQAGMLWTFTFRFVIMAVLQQQEANNK